MSYVFLSYSRNNRDQALNLCDQLRYHGLRVFRDEDSIRNGDCWLDRLQDAIDECSCFIVLIGRDGVRRWIGAETQAALNRYFSPHNDALRLPIFPILLDDTFLNKLPAFLKLFHATSWDGKTSLPGVLFTQIRERTNASSAVTIEGCPFVGLAAYRNTEDHLFFGRQKETLEALACFDTRQGHSPVRWLEINGNSGSGKSSLMQAGLLPLVDQGWLWSRTGIGRWRQIGPMIPGLKPVEMLAEKLVRTFDGKMFEVIEDLTKSDDALRFWLRDRKGDDTAFLLAIDQFEELLSFADPDERRRFDCLLANALEDPECPLFVISTIRADFLDRLEELPRLVTVRNRLGKPWTLPPIGIDNLREVIAGPARLAGLDVSQVQEAMVADAWGEPGALPLVENALTWLWENRQECKLSGKLFTDHGRLAGVLSNSADRLLDELDREGRNHALEILFRLIKVDPERLRHSCQRIRIDEAKEIAGEGSLDLLDRLAGRRVEGSSAGPVRLITITDNGQWVNLIHETLIHSKGKDEDGNPQPYWPRLWTYIEKHKERAAWLRRLRDDTRLWIDNGKRDSDVWSHERIKEAISALQQVNQDVMLNVEEQEFLGPIDPKAMLDELKQPEISHRRRTLIGERLDILGDPRDGVGIDVDGTPKIDWCHIKGGMMSISVMVSDPEDPHPKYTQVNRTVNDFWLGRFPITVSQYHSFLKADDGWLKTDIWPRDLYRDTVGNSYLIGRFDNEPAVNVSWFEAMAFCRWLGRRLGLEHVVRLPDEWEWQLAGTGGDPDRIYPWGLNWDPREETNRANTIESQVGGTTAVGMYPDGISPYGVLDMAGTVYEWCWNKFETPNITETVSRADDLAYRARRGGAWSGLEHTARFTYRARLKPSSRYNNIGFRVACTSLPPCTEP